MIRGYEPPPVLRPEAAGRFQWGAALGAGFLAGAILLVVPRGSPWSTITFFSPIVMGRVLPPDMRPALPLVWIIHLAISIVYGLIISRAVAHLTQARAIFTGALVGLVLYVLNYGLVSALWHQLVGSELTVVFTHLVFGLIAGGAYRGLLRRRATFEMPPPQPS